MTPSVHANGQALDALTKVTDLVVAAEWPDTGIGGPTSATFTINLPPANRPSWLIKDTPADVRLGGTFLLAGKIAEPDWGQDSEPSTITITGAAREGENTVALDGTGKTTSTADTALDAAISRGALTWTRPASISTTPLTDGDQTNTPNMLLELLAQAARQTGGRYYVDPYRRILAGTDPTTPTYLLQPGSGELPWTTQEQATRIIGGWFDTGGVPHATAVGSGANEQKVILPRNVTNSTTATSILTNLLAAATAGGWTGGLTIAAEQIIGRPHLADVLAAVGRGCMFRLLGQRDPRTDRVPVGYVDFVCERAEWHVADGTIILTPRGMVARDWAALLADAGVEAA